VTSVQRVNTRGGRARPGCDANNVGKEARTAFRRTTTSTAVAARRSRRGASA
jgi:hypothetical protein